MKKGSYILAAAILLALGFLAGSLMSSSAQGPGRSDWGKSRATDVSAQVGLKNGDFACLVEVIPGDGIDAAELCERVLAATSKSFSLDWPVVIPAANAGHSNGGQYHGVRCEPSGVSCVDHSGMGRGNSACAMVDICARSHDYPSGDCTIDCVSGGCGEGYCETYCGVCVPELN